MYIQCTWFISCELIPMSILSRCSVLAAANPVYRRYNPYNTPRENIGLQDFLLSRFDGLFIMLDMINVDSDRKIADHVVRMHRYHSLQEQDYDYDNEDDCEDDDDDA